MKALLFMLVRSFQFTLSFPESEYGTRSTVVRRPMLVNEPTISAQLPLFVTPYTS
jgi:hypothetical protein